ncbi:MAG: PQQ-like beta-propeller repeat protein [Planctomycetes bacterium]|nr:PQQ-like beta-propeller repeat protein [Planctomycetota bacterium]
MKSTRILALAVCLLGATTAISADWPQWRGPNRDGISKDTGLLKAWPTAGPKLLWTFEEAGVGYGTPAVVGDRLYILGSEDPEKGDKEFLTCINSKDGKIVWKKELDNSAGGYSTNWGSGPRSSPTVDGDFVYVLGARGDLQCRKVSDGSKVWGISLVKDLGGKIPGWGYSESILIDGENLLCTPGGAKGTIACLKKATGAVVWRSTELTEGAAYSSIVISNVGVKQYITLVPGGTVSVSAAEGKLLWKSPAGKNGVAVIPTAVVNDKYVFVTSGYGSGCGLLELTADGKDGVKMKEIYLNKAMLNQHGGVINFENFLYGFSDKGSWLCLDYLKLDKDNETPAWKSSKLDKGSITFADGHFYCYGQGKGVCVLIEANPKEWKETGRFEIPKKSKFPRRSGAIWSHPVVANGKLFLRDHEVLSCFDVKGLD